jgi:hypothetical protein
MEPELQNHFEEFKGPYEILEELKTMFQTQARSERYAISVKFFDCKMEEGSSFSEHAIKMSGYTQRLEQLDYKIPEELKIDRVLQSLPPSYKGFVVTHNQIGSIVTRVNSINVLDEGLRIGGVGCRMNSKVKSVKQGACQK